MKKIIFCLGIHLLVSCAENKNPLIYEERKVSGLDNTVEILRDHWGINHIYAENQHDLFLLKGMLLPRIVCFNLKFGEDKLLEQLKKFLAQENWNGTSVHVFSNIEVISQQN